MENQAQETNNDEMNDVQFINEFNKIAQLVNHVAMTKGFWEERVRLVNESLPDMKTFADQCMVSSALSLIHSEISEALEASRHGNPNDDKITNYSGVEAELADAIIRIMDLCYYKKWDIAGAIIEKIKYNTSRPYKHGKQF